jgi:hypothetical protein
MNVQLRTCRRTGCNDPAAATLSFRYDTRQVWVHLLTADVPGTRYDLCAAHADALTVPRGWHQVDERPPRPPEAFRSEPEPQVQVPVPQPARPVVVDRYARLLAELPRPASAPEVLGQLAIPVGERNPTDAVVVSIAELAGARRARQPIRQ